MPDHDEESTTPFMVDTSQDEKYTGPVSIAWRDAAQSLTVSASLRRLQDGFRIANTHLLQHAQSGFRSADAYVQRRFPALRLHNQRRRNVVALSAILILVVSSVLLVLNLTHSHHPPPLPPPPPRLYCSTWGSATPIPENLWDRLYSEYRHWTQYDKADTFKLVPEQQPVPAADTHLPHGSKKKPAPQEDKSTTADQSPAKIWRKPTGVKVIALIFFGRPHQVDVLDCYLQKNMVHQGGYLDEVHFIEHTTRMADLEYLHNLVAATPGYKALEVAPHCREDPHRHDCRYERIWEHFATDDDTIYIKMDDDIVYIHEETIPRLVHRRIDFAQPFAISANIVNSPLTAWMHYRLGAVHPYLPEPAPVRRAPGNPQTWRASELPIHPNDDDYKNLQFGRTPNQEVINSAIRDEDMLNRLFQDVPYSGHRWLPLTQNTTSLLYTPISRITIDPWGPGVHNWAVAAQQHYSLLQNIEENAMHRYWMAAVPPLGEGLFNPQYSRYNLNFIAVWGKDVVEGARVRQEVSIDSNGDEKTRIVSDMDDDEKNLTVDMPRSLGRPMVIDVQAVVAHMHFHDQEPYMQMTDVLDRWRAYVNDQVCPVNRQKKVPGQMDGLGYTHLNKGNGRWQCPWVTVEYNGTYQAGRSNPN